MLVSCHNTTHCHKPKHLDFKYYRHESLKTRVNVGSFTWLVEGHIILLQDWYEFFYIT